MRQANLVTGPAQTGIHSTRRLTLLLSLLALGAPPIVGQITLAPDTMEVGPSEVADLEVTGCAGSVGFMVVGTVLQTVDFPGVGIFDVDITSGPIAELGVLPEGGLQLSCGIGCGSPLLGHTFYLQAIAFDATAAVCGISNVAVLDVGTVLGEGSVVPDCDEDGSPDACEVDTDGDGVPDDCDTCPAPGQACEVGCWDLANTDGSLAPPAYGLRLEGLLGVGSGNYTFSWEHPGASGQLCYDGNGTLSVSGLAYGGLDIGDAWDATEQGFLEVEFVYTGAICNGSGDLVVPESGGTGTGTVTWLNTGEVIPLLAEANGDGVLTEFSNNSNKRFEGWLRYQEQLGGVQDWRSDASPSADCLPDCDADGTLDVVEPDCDSDGVPDDCEIDSNFDGTPDDCEVCPAPVEACDVGCWDLEDTSGSLSPPTYGLRLDNLFGTGSGDYTFSWEHAGASGQLCYDGNGMLSVSGLAYGGLDIGGSWDASEQGFLEVEFVYTGASCDGEGDLVVLENGGTGTGSVTWLNTGEVIPLMAEANQEGVLVEFKNNNGKRLKGWMRYQGQSDGTQDWRSNASANTSCSPGADCDGDGIPDLAEADSDDDGIPNDCEVCPAPAEVCDTGCWNLEDTAGSLSPPTYGLRLDNLFGTGSGDYTFSWEHAGASGQLCYDGNGMLSVSGLAYGGLDIGGSWDASEQGFLEVEFTYTGAFCNEDGDVVVTTSSGTGSGSVTWLNTGQVITLLTEANEDGVFVEFRNNSNKRLDGWLRYQGQSDGSQDWRANASASTACPPQ